MRCGTRFENITSPTPLNSKYKPKSNLACFLEVFLKSVFSVQSPTRIDLSGGTLDCWPLYLFVKKACTINLAISIYTQVELQETPDSSIELEMKDLSYKKTFQNLKEFLTEKEDRLKLIQAHLAYWKPEKGFSLKTFSQSPIGAGLGGSSSLCISLLKVFSQWLKKPLSEVQMVELAHNLEAQALESLTGTQDYIPALREKGGIHIIDYSPKGFSVKTISEGVQEMFENIFIVYTGEPHHSGFNNWKIIQDVMNKKESVLSCLEELAYISQCMAEVCEKRNWNQIPELFEKEFVERSKLNSFFVSDPIRILKKLVLKEGAKAIKICGAGGGGCVLVWADSKDHARLKQLCRDNSYTPLEAQCIV